MREHKPCPFCGRHVGYPQWERHSEDCYFTLDRHFQLTREKMTTKEADRYIENVLHPAWNTRVGREDEI